MTKDTKEPDGMPTTVAVYRCPEYESIEIVDEHDEVTYRYHHQSEIDKRDAVIEILKDALEEVNKSRFAIYKCIHHGHPTQCGPEVDEQYMSCHTEIIKNKIEQALTQADSILE